MKLTPELKAWLVEHGTSKEATDAEFEAAAKKALGDGTLTVAKLAELQGTKGTPSPRDVFGGSSVRVKTAGERYSTERTSAKHCKTGLPVRDERGREVAYPSELEHAKSGAFFKFLARRQGLSVVLGEHENSLLEECFQDPWCGRVGGDWKDNIPGAFVKASLLNDATSGGAEVVPAWLDENLVTFPLLSGELFPFCDVRDVPKSAAVDGASIGNPTASWGTSEGTGLTPFDATSLIAEIATSIKPVAVGVEIGRDFLADSPADVGRILTEAIGARMASELDRVIAVGNGTTEPQGITVAAGLVGVSSTNGNAGPPTVTDYESLIFGIGKQYRTPAMRCAFLGNDISYRRARGIPVSGTDERRVFGMDHQSYQLLEHRYAICASLANAKIAFGALSKYRMYRRQGFEVRFETGGRTLSLANLALLLVRGRFGGRVVDANAFSIITDAQT